MAGDDPILAVSKVFAALTDEVGAGVKSFDALNTLFKNSLTRNMVKFNKAVEASTKSLLVFNKSLKLSSTGNNRNTQLRQTQRYSAGTQSSQALIKAANSLKTQQVAKQNSSMHLENAFDDLADRIQNPLLVAISHASSNLNGFANIVSNMIQVFLLLKNLSKAEIAVRQTSNKALGDWYKTYVNSKENQAEIDKMYANLMGNIGSKLKQSSKKTADAIKDTINIKYPKRTPKPETPEGYINIQEAKQKIPTLKEQRPPKMSRNYETVSDMAKSFANSLGSAKTAIMKWVGGLRASTVLLGGAVVTLAAAVVASAYDIMGAVPRMLNRLKSGMDSVIKTIIDPFSSMFNKLTGFVSKLNPSYGIEAERALANLSAVIGKAVLPIFMVFLRTIQVFTIGLNASLKDLQPSINAFAKVLAQIAGGALGVFFKLLANAKPILEEFVKALQELQPYLYGLFDQLAQILQNNMPIIKDAIKVFGDFLGKYLTAELEKFQAQLNNASRAIQIDTMKVKLFGESAADATKIFNWLYNAMVALVQFIDFGFTIVVEGVGQALLWLIDPINLLGKVIYTVWDILSSIPLVGKYLGKPSESLNQAGWSPYAFPEKQPKQAPMANPNQPQGQANWWQNIFGGNVGQQNFAATGASYGEIGDLGKNLAAASFGAGADTGQQQVDLLSILVGLVGDINRKDQQFNGAMPVQGVR